MTETPRRRPSRRQAAALVAATGAVVAIGLVTTSSGGAGAAAASGPTVAAEARDLTVTDDERGTLARADTTTVLYDGTGGRVGGGPPGADVSAQSTGVATPAVLEDPCDPSSSSRPATCAPTTTTTVPATSSSTWPSTVLNPPVDDGPDPADDPADDPLDEPRDQPSDQPSDQGDAPPTDGPTADQADGDDQGALGSGSSTATLTELLAVGETATRGSVLYRADDEPIVALLSATPLFRDLRTGVTDGPDVAAIESELRTLGYDGFTVDEHYDRATAAAVREWEEDLGRSTADGVITVGEVQLLDEPAAVLEHQAEVGDLLEPGEAVLVLGAESLVIEADVEADEAADWAVGTTLTIEWADGTTSTGSVVEVGRDVTDAQIEIVIAVADDAGAEVPVGTRVDLVRTVTEHRGVVSVPVSAVVEGDDGPAVRVAGADEDRRVDVELGVVDDGWVEVTSGLDVGTEVRLPA